MQNGLRVTVATTIGLAALFFTNPALARDGDAIGFEIAGFNVGAVLDSVLASTRVYVISPPYYYPYYYYGPMAHRHSVPNRYGNDRRPGSERRLHPAADGLRPGPTRSKTAKTGVFPVTVEQDSEAKLKAAKIKAAKLGLEKLTREDIDGLSREQLKQLRGY
jgi:hypothetical protein